MIGGERPMLKARLVAGLLTVTLVTTPSLSARPALAASAADINRDANTALAKLYENIPEARPLGANAKGILIFPSIVKAGFLFGAQYGEGALRQKGKTGGYYITVAASYGLQAGVQSFGYVLFFMSDGPSATWTRATASRSASGRASSSWMPARRRRSRRRPPGAMSTCSSSTRRV
jgi:lipid-binding SYLF domain-containing protein